MELLRFNLALLVVFNRQSLLRFFLTVRRWMRVLLSIFRIRLYFCTVTMMCSMLFYIGQTGSGNTKATFELYGGYQTSPHSVVSGEYLSGNIQEGMVPFTFTAGWKGKSFSMPPYYGLRFTHWNSRSGWGLDFTHSKVYADLTTLAQANLQLLQFTDGLNNVIVHRQIKSFVARDKYQMYYGYGAGIIVPHVEFQHENSIRRTFEYQYGGPSVAFNSGFKVITGQSKFVFAEYKFTASWLDVDLSGGGNLQTRIFTNALNVGFGFEF